MTRRAMHKPIARQLVCDGCGDGFEYMSAGSGAPPKFCSDGCRRERYLEQMAAANSRETIVKDGLIWTVNRKICPVCSREFESLGGNGERPDRVCSEACRREAKRLSGVRRRERYAIAGIKEIYTVYYGDCAICGKPFSSTNKTVKTCGTSCGGVLSRRNVSRATRDCAICGKPFVPYHPGPRDRAAGRFQRACVGECSKNLRLLEKQPKAPKIIVPKVVPEVACVQCSRMFTPRSNQKLCSDDCRSVVREHNKVAARIVQTSRQCPVCDRIFVNKSHNRDTCSDKCQSRSQKMKYHHYSSRVRHFGVEYEPVNRIKVFDRDGWRCHICGRKTLKSRMGTMHLKAPELDHRIPMSKGGGHTYENCQCACRRCNMKKGNRNESGQIPLFSLDMLFDHAAMKKDE